MILASDGRNIEAVRDNLQCLAGQTDSDFEVIVVGYDLDQLRHVALHQAIEWHDAPLRERSRYMPSYEVGDAAGALNRGLALATGQYATVIDDHALPFAHWAASLRRLAAEQRGKLVRLSYRLVEDGKPFPLGEPSTEDTAASKPADFFVELWGEAVPSSCIAFPTALARDQALRFDPAFPHLLAWHFAVRGAALCGVESSEIVGVAARARPAVPAGELEKLRGGLEALDFVLPGDRLRQLAVAAGGVARASGVTPPADAPFLSVLSAVDFDDLQPFRDLVLCLASQSDMDFELIAAPTGDVAKASETLTRAMRAFPRDLRAKVAIVPAAGASEAAALNLALVRVQGRFVAVASRDGLPSSNWTASLRALAGESRRHALRVGTKYVDEARGAGNEVANIERQVACDLGPSVAYAFPASLIVEYNIRFDDTLARTFLWDFRVRVLSTAPLLIHPIEAVVALGAGPQPEEAELARLRAGFDQLSLLFPPGTVGRLKALEAARTELSGQVHELASLVARTSEENVTLSTSADALVAEIEQGRVALARHAREIEELNHRIAKLSKPRGVKRLIFKLRKLTGKGR